MNVKTVISAGIGAALIGMAAPALVMADTITITSWGGSYSMSQRKAYHEPFMKETGHVVLEDEWSGDIAMIRAMVDTGNYKTHIIDAVPDVVIAGCDEGIWSPSIGTGSACSPTISCPELVMSAESAPSAGRPYLPIEAMCIRTIHRRTGRISGMSPSILASVVSTKAIRFSLWSSRCRRMECPPPRSMMCSPRRGVSTGPSQSSMKSRRTPSDGKPVPRRRSF